MKKCANIFAAIALIVATAIYLLLANGWRFQPPTPEYDLPDIHIKGE